jgi:hypothetical protein
LGVFDISAAMLTRFSGSDFKSNQAELDDPTRAGDGIPLRLRRLGRVLQNRGNAPQVIHILHVWIVVATEVRDCRPASGNFQSMRFNALSCSFNIRASSRSIARVPPL